MGRDPSYKRPGDVIVTTPMEPELRKRIKIYCAQRDLSTKEFMLCAAELMLTQP